MYQNDIFPDEGLWLWKNSIPMLGPVRSFALGTILGPQKESQINWYLQTGYSEKMLGQLAPQLDKIGQIILHCAISVCDCFSILYSSSILFTGEV